MDSRHQGLTREHDDGGLLLRVFVRLPSVNSFGKPRGVHLLLSMVRVR
jgi:hypothetical protein